MQARSMIGVAAAVLLWILMAIDAHAQPTTGAPCSTAAHLSR